MWCWTARTRWHLFADYTNATGQLTPSYDSYSISLMTFLCCLLLTKNMDIELNPGPGVEGKNLSVAHMNVCSLYMSSIKHNPRVKIDEIISTLVVDKDVDILCISESWLHDQIDKDLIKIPGYQTPLRKDRKDKRGGGVCVYVTENIIRKQLTEHEPEDTDLLWLELRLQNKRVVVGTCYRPPGQNRAEADHFIDQLGTSLAKGYSNKSRIYNTSRRF